MEGEILTCSTKCILLYGYMNTEYTRDYNKCLLGANALEHLKDISSSIGINELLEIQVLGTKSSWYSSVESLWGPCGLSSTHQQDLRGFGAVMCWNENQLWSDAEAEEGLRSHNAKMEYLKCFKPPSHLLIFRKATPCCHLGSNIPTILHVVPRNRGHFPITLYWSDK